LARLADNTPSNADVSRLLDAFEEAIEDLRIAYEKYFLGVDRQAPVNKHRKLTAQMRRIEELRPRSTALRFRFAGLKARMVTYQHYWNRILTQIEKGTFRRDIQQRVQRRNQGRPRSGPQPSADAPLDPASSPSAAPSEPARPEPEPEAPRAPMTSDLSAPRPVARPPGPPQPPPPPVAVPGMKTTEVQQLHRALVSAKQAAGEDVKGITMRALARKLSRELPKLRERHGGSVRFEVATVAGKVRLRARSGDGE